MADLKDKFPVKSAVYFITDKETGKSYVGSTSNIQDRIKYHRNRLNKNIHNNKELQAAYNNNPGLEVIYAVVETKEEAPVEEVKEEANEGLFELKKCTIEDKATKKDKEEGFEKWHCTLVKNYNFD